MKVRRYECLFCTDAEGFPYSSEQLQLFHFLYGAHRTRREPLKPLPSTKWACHLLLGRHPCPHNTPDTVEVREQSEMEGTLSTCMQLMRTQEEKSALETIRYFAHLAGSQTPEKSAERKEKEAQ